MFEIDPQEQVSVASFVREICKAGYHPIFYTNIGEFFEPPPDGPFTMGKIENKKTEEVGPIGGCNQHFFLGTTETPVQTRKNTW